MELKLEVTVRRLDIYNMKLNIPIEVQLRLFLNENGFKFQDDGKISSIINKNPLPLGDFYVTENIEDGSFTYRQTLSVRGSNETSR